MTRMTNKRSRRSDAVRTRHQPSWQPVAAVGMLTAVVTEQLAHTRAQLALMEQARPTRPDARILDDHTISETLRVYGKARKLHQTCEKPQVTRSSWPWSVV
jgi:hypothetical protein